MIGFLILASHVTAVLLLSIFTHRLWLNLRFLRDTRRKTRLTETAPRVSVLVPARNEGGNIVSCMESLAYQDYPNYEIIVLDDQSSDETGALLDELAARHSNVTALHGSEDPPAGWNGKSYACQRLANQATGEWLLFTDADTHHKPSSIAQGVAQAQGLQVDLLSAFPSQITGSWSERVIVSFILDFLPLIALDLPGLWRGDSGSTAANGQYLLVRAATYRTIGGHKAIFDALVDDFALAKHVRSTGHKVALVDGTSMLSCRMYHNAREVWDGFSKNILLGLETSSAEKRRWWWRLLFAWGYACAFVLPFYNLLFASDKLLSLLEIGWLGTLRGIVNWHFARPLSEIASTPLAAWSVMAFGLGAVLRRRSGKYIRWKGRDYTITS
jgi:chlorobactene glucosyltransferase